MPALAHRKRSIVTSTFDTHRGVVGRLIVLLALLATAPALVTAQSGTPGVVPAPTPAPDPTRDASARAMFEEGVLFVEAGDFVQAEDRFRRALALRESPVIVYNLASTLVERGKVVEAVELLRKLSRDPHVDEEMRQSATDLQTQASARIGRLRVTVEGGAAEDVVTLDRQPLMAAQLGVDIPVDPGSHELQVRRGETVVDTQTAEIAPGAGYEVTLRGDAAALSPSAVAAASVAPTALPAPPPKAADDDRPITSTWWFWTGAAVLAGAAVATAVILASDSDPEVTPPFRGDFDPPSLALEVAP